MFFLNTIFFLFLYESLASLGQCGSPTARDSPCKAHPCSFAAFVVLRFVSWLRCGVFFGRVWCPLVAGRRGGRLVPRWVSFRPAALRFAVASDVVPRLVFGVSAIPLLRLCTCIIPCRALLVLTNSFRYVRLSNVLTYICGGSKPYIDRSNATPAELTDVF